MRIVKQVIGRIFRRNGLVAALALQLAVTGCTTLDRLPAVPSASAARMDTNVGHLRYLVARETKSFTDDAREALRKEQAYLASAGHQGPMPPAIFLAISGGSDNGAFGAGLLNGWTTAGTRPVFKGVTGISTGALIAPFAFLGAKYDHVLKEVYTQTSQKQILKKHGLLKGLFGDAMADTAPLAALIARYTDQAFIDEVGAEYAKGRILLVGTTNLDTLEPVIWNMTAIAASKDPQAPELFRKVLLASASIPGGFPPVMIDVQVDGTRYQEMHVDGGTAAQVFLYPPSLHVAEVSSAQGLERQRAVYIIRNSRLDADWASVERKLMPIASRAISSLIQTQGIGDLYRIYGTTQRDGIDFNLAFIPSTFTVPHLEVFDTNYMRQLFALGEEMAVKGYPWQKYPPGYSAPALQK